jgi:hypothetical protein
MHTTGIKFRADKTLIDIYERVEFASIEVIDSLDDLARLYYSSILFRNNGNCDNV